MLLTSNNEHDYIWVRIRQTKMLRDNDASNQDAHYRIMASSAEWTCDDWKDSSFSSPELKRSVDKKLTQIPSLTVIRISTFLSRGLRKEDWERVPIFGVKQCHIVTNLPLPYIIISYHIIYINNERNIGYKVFWVLCPLGIVFFEYYAWNHHYLRSTVWIIRKDNHGLNSNIKETETN